MKDVFSNYFGCRKMTASENPYPSSSTISNFQRAKIDELRSRLKSDLTAYPEYGSDFQLLRWLVGWDYNIEVVIPKIQRTLATFKNIGIFDLRAIDAQSSNAYVRSLHNLAEYFPGGSVGPDRDGNMIYVHPIALINPRTLAKSGAVSDLFRYGIIEIELAAKLVRIEEEKRGQKLGMKVVVDLDGFTMDLIHPPTLKLYLSVLSLIQDMYPDFARKIYVINPPLMVQTAYALVSPVLAKQTREKVEFLGKNWKEVITNDFGEENIYSHWGGTKPSDKPTGDMRLGGKVPKSMWFDSENSGYSEKFEKINVPARSLEKVSIKVRNGQTLKWTWQVSSGDLDFWIERTGKQVYPKFRLSTEFHPDQGSLRCDSDAEYTLFFDNSHGKLFSKDVKYKIIAE